MEFLKKDPSLLKFFNAEINPRIDLSIITTGSRKEITWKCKNNHTFERKMSEFKKSQSCPVCRKSKNPLSKNKKLMKEWDYAKNKALNPENISEGNNRLKVWWNCKECSNNWESRVYSRAKKNTGCPKCASIKKHSRNEMRIYAELTSLFNDVKNDFILSGYSYDIIIKDINLIIEYDGYNWHKDNLSIDKKKNKIAQENNFKIIRLREKGLNKLSENDILIPFDFNLKRDFKTQKDLVNLLLDYIENEFNLDFKEYKISDDFINKSLYNKYENKIKHKHTVADNKKLKDEWGINLNKGILPQNISLKTSSLYWWRCKKGDDHVWESSPLNRQSRGCPFCSNKKLSKTNRFDLNEPELLRLWNIDKNKKSPKEYTNRNSVDIISWNCSCCDQPIKKTIRAMVDTNGYCPNCKSRNKR